MVRTRVRTMVRTRVRTYVRTYMYTCTNSVPGTRVPNGSTRINYLNVHVYVHIYVPWYTCTRVLPMVVLVWYYHGGVPGTYVRRTSWYLQCYFTTF